MCSAFFSFPLLRYLFRYSFSLLTHVTFPRFFIGQRSQFILWSVLAPRGSRNFSLASVVIAFFFTKNKINIVGYTADESLWTLSKGPGRFRVHL